MLALQVLALQVELCSPRLLASRTVARWRPSGFGRGSGRRASQTSLLPQAPGWEAPGRLLHVPTEFSA